MLFTKLLLKIYIVAREVNLHLLIQTFVYKSLISAYHRKIQSIILIF